MSTIAPMTTRRLAAAAGLALTTLAAAVVPAAAHVTVAADDTTRGAHDTVLSFRVPNESDHAATVRVEIAFPEKTPIASVRPAAPPGWTFRTTPVVLSEPVLTDDGTLAEGVGSVIFTASPGAGIPPGAFAAFDLLVGALPDSVDAVSFPTVQTYEDGTVERWVDPVVAGRDQPDNPAPTLELTASTPTADAGQAPGGSGPVTREEVGTGLTSGLLGLVLGALGAVLGAVGMLRGGQRTAPRERPPVGLPG